MALAFLLIPLLLIVLYCVHKFTKLPVFKYLFFLRVPLFCALFLVLYPTIAEGLAKSLLANTLVLLSGHGYFLVILTGVLIAGMVQMVTLQITENAPERFGVEPLVDSKVMKWLFKSWWTLPLILPIPLIYAVWVNSYTLSGMQRVIWAVLALLVGLFLVGLVNLSDVNEFIANKFAKFMTSIFGMDSAFTDGYVHKVNGKILAEPGNAKMVGLTFLLVVIYAVIGLTFKPPEVSIPALFFVLFLVLILGFLLSLATFFLDYFRLPAVGFLLFVIILMFNISGIRHFYQLIPLEDADISEEQQKLFQTASETLDLKVQQDLLQNVLAKEAAPDETESQEFSEAFSLARSNFVTALRNRLADQPEGNKTLVVVGASGGGIQAAGWTSQVLSGLYLHPDFGPDFSRAIGMISSVSGGSMGNMFYVDRLPDLVAAGDNKDELAKVAEAMREGAMGNALDDTAWGIDYPDFLRLLGFGAFLNPLVDRAYGLETFLASQMAKGDARLLRDWRKLIMAGELPTTVFNATIVESGDRFLISPMDFPSAEKAEAFSGLFPGYDMNAVTGARLSATFPYVTPVARPYFVGAEEKPDCEKNPMDCYHVADGGYFDNFGIFTIVEWLDHVILPINREELGIRNIIIIEINAFPTDATMPSPLSGFMAAAAGPVQALTNVRNSTQIARNKSAISFLTNQWADEVTVSYVDLRFSVAGEPSPCEQVFPNCPDVEGHWDFENYEPPLSWKLSPREKEAVCEAWTQLACEDGGAGLKTLKEAWEEARSPRPTQGDRPPQADADQEF